MTDELMDEVFSVSVQKDLAETGGGHNQKGVEFQRHWALSRMFELESAGASDFLFLFESVQDVAELDSATAPSSIKIYQVKKKDRGEWTWGLLTNLHEPGKKKTKPLDEIKNSPLGKLYASVIAFKKLKSSGHFVSNNGCALPLKGGGEAATALTCDLSKLDDEHLGLLEKGLEQLHAAGGDAPDPSKIHVKKVAIPPDAPGTHLVGIAVEFLSSRSPRHAGQARALVDALLTQVGPLGAKTASCADFNELRRERGYSRDEFTSALGSLEHVPDMEALLNDWLAQLQSEGGMEFMERAAVRMAASNIFRRQVMGGDSPSESALAASLEAWLDENKPSDKQSEFLAKAVSEVAPLHRSIGRTDFLAHFALRALKKCADLT